MGVYIKGMEMPKDGCHHMICIYADGTVSTGGRVYMAVPVPPHGRLIDADAAYDSIAEVEHAGNYVDMDAVGIGIDDTPTVIPADEDGEI